MGGKITSITMDEELIDEIEYYRKKMKPELTRGQYIEVACLEKIAKDKRKEEGEERRKTEKETK